MLWGSLWHGVPVPWGLTTILPAAQRGAGSLRGGQEGVPAAAAAVPAAGLRAGGCTGARREPAEPQPRAGEEAEEVRLVEASGRAGAARVGGQGTGMLRMAWGEEFVDGLLCSSAGGCTKPGGYFYIPLLCDWSMLP